jgi:hypothetical protein
MSSYQDKAWNPETKQFELAWWIDDYFGRHQYGVRFEGEEKIYRPHEVEPPTKGK